MSPRQIKELELIERLVSIGDVESAIAKFLQFEGTVSNDRNILIQLSSKNHTVQKDYSSGIIKYEEYIKHRTLVANGVIQIKNTVYQRIALSKHLMPDFSEKNSVSNLSSKRDEVHLLIEPGDDFNDLLRQMIYVHTDISVKSDFFVEKSQRFENYKKGLDDFLADKKSKWLLTVYPEEHRCRLNKKQEQSLIEKLLLSGKRIICFESGFRLRKHPLNRDNSVIVIGTNHQQASQYLISHLAKNFLQKSLNVHIVSIAGPIGHSAADARRAVNR